MDVLDQILADVRHESCVFCRLEATEPWRIQKSASAVAPFYAVLSGTARIETATTAYDLCAGDFLVLPGGAPHELAGSASASAPPVPLVALLAEGGVEPWRPGVRYRRTVHLQHGGSGAPSVLLIGIFSFGDPRRNHLLSALPPVLVVRGGTDRQTAWVTTLLKSGDSETRRSALCAVSARVSGDGPAQHRRLDARHHGPACRACHLVHARGAGTPLDRAIACRRGPLFESRLCAALQCPGRPGTASLSDRMAHARRRWTAARWRRQPHHRNRGQPRGLSIRSGLLHRLQALGWNRARPLSRDDATWLTRENEWRRASVARHTR